ncbi:rac GTPase-activating protein 1-like isoform X2 [Lineus longissimus]|uniref:rac GTPase-activating protein 1-like isoform X2 n=1 Tax=Lineus longissimus TaxID=88925 RepID=UPI002B4E1707
MGSKDTLSLVAAFDDLVRNANVLTAGVETEFMAFVKNQEQCRKKWLAAEEGSSSTSNKIRKLEMENQALDTKLKHARSQIDHEMKRRIKAEQEKECMERQIALIRDLLQKEKQPGHGQSLINDQERERVLSYFNNTSTFNHNSPYGSNMDPVSPRRLDTINESNTSVVLDSDYDKTEEDLDESSLRSGRRWKRRRAPTAPPPEESDDESDGSSKRRRTKSASGEANTSITATTTIRIPPHGGTMTATSEIQTDAKRHQRKKSNGHNDDNTNSNSNNPRGILKDKTNQETKKQTTPGSPVLIRTYSSAGRLNKGHLFVTKSILRIESCGVCNKRIGFGSKALRCRDCRTTAHIDCKDKVPLPCVPNTPATPGTSKKEMGVVADYASNEAPMVPALVIHCIREVEQRGLAEPGLYRVPGSDKEIRELKEKFLHKKGVPKLSAIDDIHVICGCMKSFLRGLREPLVTFDLWKDFVHATELNDKDEALCHVYQAVSELPQPNRDTMAYLILHLQRVADCPECKMPISNLAKVFGPTIVGYSTPEPEPMQMINETKKQAMVVDLLMTITSDYWANFINVEDDGINLRSLNFVRTDVHTPELRVPSSMLGPVNGSMTKKAQEVFGVTPRTSRTRTGPRHFFSSPTLN